MKTYKTIQQAFDLGSGDCFFTKDNEFIAVSRKDIEKHNLLESDGFRFMPYEEIRTEALKTTDTTSAVIWKKAHDNSNEPKKVAPKRNNYCPDIYEFSDADPGL